VIRRSSLVVHEVATGVAFRGERVVRATAQRNVVRRVFAVARKGLDVVELEAVRFSAALPRDGGVGTTPSIALVDGAPDRRGNVSTAPSAALGLRGLSGLSGLSGLWIRSALARGLGPRLGVSGGPWRGVGVVCVSGSG
jgi:hypothetical protein